MRTNWKAANKPFDEGLEQSDLICVVKKPDPHIIKRARQMWKPIVLDIVDS